MQHPDIWGLPFSWKYAQSLLHLQHLDCWSGVSGRCRQGPPPRGPYRETGPTPSIRRTFFVVQFSEFLALSVCVHVNPVVVCRRSSNRMRFRPESTQIHQFQSDCSTKRRVVCCVVYDWTERAKCSEVSSLIKPFSCLRNSLFSWMSSNDCL